MSPTARQMDALRFIHRYHGERGRTPSQLEIGDALGINSRSGVIKLLDGLQERGFIRRTPGQHRSIAIVPVTRDHEGVPLYSVRLP